MPPAEDGRGGVGEGRADGTVADRDQADWVTLRDALVAERLADEEGTSTPEPYASFLSTTESDADVAAALTGLDTHLDELQAAWDAALEEE